jgi:hypothetical protein
MSQRKELNMKSFSPALVGFLRGLLLAAATGALNFAIAQVSGLSGGDSGAIGLLSTVLVGVLRSLEGVVDQKLGAPRQARMLGGKPVRR